MKNSFLATIAVSLFVFHILFSIYYSTQIVKLNHNFQNLMRQYTDLENKNQLLESKYVKFFQINDQKEN